MALRPAPRMCFVVLVAVVALVSPAKAVAADFFLDKPDRCFASTKPPEKPMPLEFCYWLNDNSCCVPGNDLAAENAFYALVGTGAGCSTSEHVVRATNNELRDFLCLGCDPKEPTYRYLGSKGDKDKGGVLDGDASLAPDQYVWRICASFLYGKDNKTGLWGGDGSKFNRCGLQIPQNGSAVLTFPQAEYGLDAPDQQTAAKLFLSVIPQWIPGFMYQVVDDTDPLYNWTAAPCFRGTNAAMGHATLFVVLATALALFMS